jgi:hypothetical protein
MRAEMWVFSPEPAVGGSVTPGTRQARQAVVQSSCSIGLVLDDDGLGQPCSIAVRGQVG